MKAIVRWVSNHRELFYCAAAIALTLLAYHALRDHVDPRIGYDGWSDVLYTLSNAATGFVIVLCAYLSKKATHGETSDEEDEALRAMIIRGTSGAQWMYVLEMLSVAFWVGIWCWIILGRG